MQWLVCVVQRRGRTGICGLTIAVVAEASACDVCMHESMSEREWHTYEVVVMLPNTRFGAGMTIMAL